MNHRYRRLPRHLKSGVKFFCRIAEGGKQLARVIGRGAQPAYECLERLAFDILHDHIQLIAHTAAINDSWQVLKSVTRPLGRKQALVGPTDVR